MSLIYIPKDEAHSEVLSTLCRWLGTSETNSMPYIRMMLGNVPVRSQASWSVLTEEIGACAAAEESANAIINRAKPAPKELKNLIASIDASGTICSAGRHLPVCIAEVVSELEHQTCSLRCSKHHLHGLRHFEILDCQDSVYNFCA